MSEVLSSASSSELFRESSGGDGPKISVVGGRSCCDELCQMADGGLLFDTAFADPPFNRGVDYDVHKDRMSEKEYAAFTYDWVISLSNVIRPGGAIWINCPEDVLFHVMLAARECKLVLRRQAIWHFRFGQNQTHNFIASHTNAMYYVKLGAKPTWRPETVLEASDRASIYRDPRTYDKDEPEMAGRRVPLDVWCGPGFGRVQGNNKERQRLHKNQLPLAYLRRALAPTTPPGGSVIDPFVGSGTTLVAADELGFSATGIDLSTEYAKSAFQRVLASRKERRQSCS